MSHENQTTETNAAPDRRYKIGLNYLSFWANQTDSGTDYGIKLHRRYRDPEGNWHSTDTFRYDDLLAVAKLAQVAHTELMYRQEAKN